MINSIDKAPAGATHRYEHGGLVSWYREVDDKMFTWRDGSWFASFFKSAQDLAQSCMLGRVEAIPAMPAEKNAERNVPSGLVVEMIRTLKKTPSYFTASELMEIHQLVDSELTKRDAAVCGGEHRKKFVLVLGDGTFGLVIDNGLTWTHDLGRATIMSEKGWEQFKRFGKLEEVRHLHWKLVMLDGGAA